MCMLYLMQEKWHCANFFLKLQLEISCQCKNIPGKWRQIPGKILEFCGCGKVGTLSIYIVTHDVQDSIDIVTHNVKTVSSL